MDAYSHAAEIAAQLVSVNYEFSLDEVLCSPHAAAEFDQIAGEFAPGFSTFEYRWAALTLRKRARLSKSLAKKHFLDWLKKTLPRATPLRRCTTAKYEQPGVYVLANGDRPLYVGETSNLRSRIEQTLQTECWAKFDPRSLKFVPGEDNRRQQHGLQSVLIHRTKPLLNWQLLRPELEPAL
jgi:site-specific DNA-methyltransferase (adenine-specific)